MNSMNFNCIFIRTISGRMIVPVGPDGGTQYLMQFDKDASGKVDKKQLMGVMVITI
jgi:protein-L-isoaspartate(D-aspartate) O-methyltransferase